MPVKAKLPFFILDDLIRRGHIQKAIHQFLDLCKTHRFSRRDRLTASSLARRLGLHDFGLKLMHPLMDSDVMRARGEHATAEEIAEYAALLTRAGAPVEACEWLSHPLVMDFPLRELYLSYAAFCVWDYRAAIGCLDRFFKSPSGVDDYGIMVARSNYVAALVNEREFARSSRQIEELLSQTQRLGLDLLHANLLKIAAEAAVDQGDLTSGQRLIDRADRFARRMGTRDQLFVAKWKAIIQVKRGDRSADKSLEAVKRRALQIKHWETARACDSYLAISQQSAERLWGVYFGTPYESFRKRLLSDFGMRADPPDAYLRRGEGETLDVTGLSTQKTGLTPGDAKFRLLKLLASDFYRPFRIPTLFQQVFPDERFNPSSGPPRVRMLIARLRQTLKRDRFETTIEHADDGYRFIPRCPVRMNLTVASLTRSDGLVQRAKDYFQAKSFSIRDFSKLLDTPTRTSSRTLTRGVAEGFLERSGNGKATRYRFR